MAYNRKYYLPFQDFKGQNWELELAKEDYSGGDSLVYGTGNPVIINDPNQGKGKLVPIKGSKMEMDFLISPALKSMFREDFGNSTDRQFRAILNKVQSGNVYKASCEITNFDVAGTSTDSEATIEIINAGTSGNVLTSCKIEFQVYSDVQYSLEFWAAPDSVNVNDSTTGTDDQILLADVTVEVGDTKSDIENKIITANNKFKVDPDFSSSTFIKMIYEETEYNTDSARFDTDWQIKLLTIQLIKYYYYFTAKPERDYIELTFHESIENPGQNPNPPRRLARHDYTPGETRDSVAQDLVNQINSQPIFESVYFPGYSEKYDVNFNAAISDLDGDTIDITIVGIGESGNVEIYSEARPVNETFVGITRKQGSAYDWDIYSPGKFDGGELTGDVFQIFIDQQVPFDDLKVAEVYTQPDDTAQDIINKLVTDLNDRSVVVYSAEVDPTNPQKLNFYLPSSNSNGDIWEYYFVTDGTSTVTPTAKTLFEVSQNKEIKWIGWVIPGIYRERLLPGYTNFTLTALDGLGDLKNIDFNVNGNMPFDLQSFKSLIANSLQKTGLFLNIFENTNLFEIRTTYDFSPLEQVYQDATRLNGKSCYDVLTEILALMRCELLQADGHWEIRNKATLADSFNWRTFNTYGVSLGSADKTYQTAIVGGTDKPNKFINAGQELEYAAPYRAVEIKQSYGFVDQLLKFPAFSNISEALEGELQNTKYPWQLRYNNTIVSPNGKVYKSGEYLNLLSYEQQNFKYYFSQKLQIGDIIQGDTKENQFELSIRYEQGKGESDYAEEFDIQFVATDGTTTVYLVESTENGFAWQETEASITLQNKETSGDSTYTLKFDYPENDLSTEEAQSEIKIFQPDTSRVYIKSIEVKINAYAKTGVKRSFSHVETRDELTHEKYEKPLNLGDVASLLNARQLYKNALYILDDDGNKILTDRWVPEGGSVPDFKYIIDHLGEFILNEYAKSSTGPPAIISADIFGPMELRDIIQISTMNDRLFTLTGGRWNVKKCLVSGEWE